MILFGVKSLQYYVSMNLNAVCVYESLQSGDIEGGGGKKSFVDLS